MFFFWGNACIPPGDFTRRVLRLYHATRAPSGLPTAHPYLFLLLRSSTNFSSSIAFLSSPTYATHLPCCALPQPRRPTLTSPTAPSRSLAGFHLVLPAAPLVLKVWMTLAASLLQWASDAA